jgi:3-oxoacyl-[acyl-carrier-protein] synthase-1
MLKTSVNPVGFVPGEAAAFVLVERTEDTRPMGSRPLASFVCGPLVPGAFHRLSDNPPDGVVLAHAIRDLLAMQSPYAKVGLVIGDLNGDEYRAQDWGSALVRLRNAHGLADARMWIPALGFGETGSAAGALALCLAARTIERGQLRQDMALVWLSDKRGGAAAVIVVPGEDT